MLLVSCVNTGNIVSSITTTKTPISPKITPNAAITIASKLIPPNVLPNAEISYTTDPLDTSNPIGWVIMFNFNTVQVTGEQLLKFGWTPDNNTDFSPPSSSYSHSVSGSINRYFKYFRIF
jgi:hypothetical protein